MLAQHINFSSNLNRLPNQNDSVVSQTSDPPQTSDLYRLSSGYRGSTGSSPFVAFGVGYKQLKRRRWSAGSGIEIDDGKKVKIAVDDLRQ